MYVWSQYILKYKPGLEERVQVKTWHQAALWGAVRMVPGKYQANIWDALTTLWPLEGAGRRGAKLRFFFLIFARRMLTCRGWAPFGQVSGCSLEQAS